MCCCHHVVVSYINTTAAIKALSDIICTSSNAVRVVESIPADKKVVFAPDRHLARWVEKESGRDLIAWPGFCVVHEQFTARKLLKIGREYPDAQLIAHPECEQSVLDMQAAADHVRSAGKVAIVGYCWGGSMADLAACHGIVDVEYCDKH